VNVLRSSWARSLASDLERGRGGAISRVASVAWARLAERSLVKTLHFRSTARIVAVGGATLGGSGKTPLAIAVTTHLARRGGRVALVGHGYGGRPQKARTIDPTDAVAEVGDEALLAAQTLAPLGVPVVIGPSRQEALDVALLHADIAVIDGMLQAAPVRAHLSLLALDGVAPWGSAACPPCGDLRGRRETLLALCDRSVRIGGPNDGHEGEDHVNIVRRGAFAGSRLLGWQELRHHRIGLATAIARPDRVLSGLRSHGVHPVVVVSHADHAGLGSRQLAEMSRMESEARLTLWLSTAKCAVSLTRARRGDVPMATIEYELHLEGPLREALDALLSTSTT
jgi:tetraacyldisaccharide 4'-kinase